MSIDRMQRVDGSLAQQLGIKILSGTLPEGFVLPSETTHAQQIGISRSALRETLRMLAAKGLVESRPRAGTRVTARRCWSLLDADLLAWQLEAGASSKFLQDLIELRMVVGPAAAALAAERRSETHVLALQESLAAMKRHVVDSGRGQFAEERFHTVVLEATRNDAVIALTGSITTAIAGAKIHNHRPGASMFTGLADHEALAEGIAQGNRVEAVKAMHRIVRRQRTQVANAFRIDRDCGGA